MQNSDGWIYAVVFTAMEILVYFVVTSFFYIVSANFDLGTALSVAARNVGARFLLLQPFFEIVYLRFFGWRANRFFRIALSILCIYFISNVAHVFFAITGNFSFLISRFAGLFSYPLGMTNEQRLLISLIITFLIFLIPKVEKAFWSDHDEVRHEPV